MYELSEAGATISWYTLLRISWGITPRIAAFMTVIDKYVTRPDRDSRSDSPLEVARPSKSTHYDRRSAEDDNADTRAHSHAVGCARPMTAEELLRKQDAPGTLLRYVDDG